jgi:acetoacetate decarboxylase
VPDPSHQVFYEWIRMPDSSGLRRLHRIGHRRFPCSFEGKPCNFVSQMYLDDDPPIVAGREIWGFPQEVRPDRSSSGVKDTLTGTLDYAGQAGRHWAPWRTSTRTCRAIRPRPLPALRKLQCLLKLIPDVDGKPKIAQLVGLHGHGDHGQGLVVGPAALHLIPHVNAPVADLPVLKVLGGRHFVADLTLPGGQVLLDYMKS